MEMLDEESIETSNLPLENLSQASRTAETRASPGSVSQRSSLEAIVESIAEELRIESGKTQKAIQNLIGYNQNRDREFEDLLSSRFIQQMENKNIFLSIFPLRHLLRKRGVSDAEWDGVFVDYRNRTAYFLEAKQAQRRIEDLLTSKLTKTSTFINSIADISRLADNVRRQQEHWRSLKDFKLHAVIGSNNIDSETRCDLVRRGFFVLYPTGLAFELDTPVVPFQPPIETIDAGLAEVNVLCPTCSFFPWCFT